MTAPRRLVTGQMTTIGTGLARPWHILCLAAVGIALQMMASGTHVAGRTCGIATVTLGAGQLLCARAGQRSHWGATTGFGACIGIGDWKQDLRI